MMGPEVRILVGEMSDSCALPISDAAGEPNEPVGLSASGGPVGDAGEVAGDSGKEPGGRGKEAGDARQPAGRGDPWNTFSFKRKGGLERRSPGEPAQVREEDTGGLS
jgi:hypothetical protein